MSTTVWWTCLDCGADAELPGGDLGLEVLCPDCAGGMSELWRWDVAA